MNIKDRLLLIQTLMDSIGQGIQKSSIVLDSETEFRGMLAHVLSVHAEALSSHEHKTIGFIRRKP